MSALRWTRPDPSWRKYHLAETPSGTVEIDYFQNAVGQPWRVNDTRGVSPEHPKPIALVFSFHRTLAEAKAHAEAASPWPAS